MRAKGKLLLESTQVSVTAGRRYGLVGPNGKGKSTLLRLIARRQIPVPEALDVLLVEQVCHNFAVISSCICCVYTRHFTVHVCNKTEAAAAFPAANRPWVLEDMLVTLTKVLHCLPGHGSLENIRQ